MTNPYQAPTTTCHSIADQRRVWIALIPFLIAVPAMVAAMALWFGRPLFRDSNAMAFGVIGTVLIFDLPVCALVLVDWLRTGSPPALSLSPLIPTREERELHRNLRNRPKLDDNDFYESFYARSCVPRHMVAQLRRILEDLTGYELAGLHPGDNLGYLDSEMDFADVLRRVERDFRVKLDWDEFRHTEVTFEFLLRVTVRCVATTNSDVFAQASTTDG